MMNNEKQDAKHESLNNKYKILFDSTSEKYRFKNERLVNSNRKGNLGLCKEESPESTKIDKTMHLILTMLSEEDQPTPIKLLLMYLRNSTKYPVSNIGWLSKICSAADLGLVRCYGKLLTDECCIEITSEGRNILRTNCKDYDRRFEITKEAQKRLESASKELALKENRPDHETTSIEEAWEKSLRNWASILASVRGMKKKVTIEDVDGILRLYAKRVEAQNNET